MDTKLDLVFNIKCNNRGLLFIIHLILNLSLNGIITDPGKLITFPLNVTVTSHQSISITSHNVFLCKVIFSLFILTVNLNKCILPDVLHSLMGTYDLMSGKKYQYFYCIRITIFSKYRHSI